MDFTFLNTIGDGFMQWKTRNPREFDRINEATCFANGEKFRDADDVLDYFTMENMRFMFNECPETQANLDAMAKRVIAEGWHMEKSK